MVHLTLKICCDWILFFKYLDLWLSNLKDQLFFCSLSSVSETLCTLDLTQHCP